METTEHELSFQDTPSPDQKMQMNEALSTAHNYTIEQPASENLEEEEEERQEQQKIEEENLEEQEDPMLIIQSFLQNPYDKTLIDKLNFSPQKLLQEKFPELSHLSFKNQYNFYKNLGVSSTKNSEKPANQNHWEHLYEMDKVQKAAKELLKKNLEEEKKSLAESECTFKPMTQLTKDSKFGKKLEETNFHERAKLWAQQKKEKIEQNRIKDLDKDLVGCTFHPIISERKTEKIEKNEKTLQNEKIEKKNETENLKENSKGVDSFIKRQAMARKAKIEKERILAKGTTQNSASKKNLKTPKEKTENWASERKKINTEENEMRNEIYVSDVTYGDALNYLHDELHKMHI